MSRREESKRIEIDEESIGTVNGGLGIGTGGGVKESESNVYYCSICKTYISLSNGVTVASHNQSKHGT